MSASQQDPLIGRLIDGRYQVRSRIARGGMATVYLATDLRLERRVAIKIMHDHLADDTGFKNRFVQEARSAAGLSHPNVVNVYDQGQDETMAYLVMEYLPGITLRELLADYGTLTPEQTTEITEAVLAGLAAAHRSGIIHRDLKPENVLLADDGRIKLGDFGLARATSKHTSTGQALLGTIAYLSPELVTRGIADARSDIYAIGIMMYEMLTGQQPFRGEQPMQIAYQHANDDVPAPSAKNPAVTPEVDELVLWATARDPVRRPADAGELLAQVTRVRRGESDQTTPLQRTMVLPDAPPAPGVADLETQVLNPTSSVAASASATDAVAALATRAGRSRAKGWLLIVLVLLLAAAGAGTGWYFGSGPGSFVDVPTVTSLSPAAAKKQLTELGLTATVKEVYSADVSNGHIVSTDPKAGTSVLKGGRVVIRVSLGRQPITVPALAGLTLDDAKAALKDAGATLGSTARRFDSQAAEDTVLKASAAEGDKNDLSDGGDYFKGLPVDLVISAGAIPDVVGMDFDDARSALGAVKLDGVQGQRSYSDDVEAGHVISATSGQDGPVAPGDTIYLEISRGPEPVTVPEVVGLHRDEAKQRLQDEGFVVSYSAWLNAIPNSLTKVTKTSPEAGSSQPKGSTVTLEITAAG